jgi:hypothetical protein
VFIRENIVALMTSYNTSYDVNVTATLCGQYTTVTATNLALNHNYGILLRLKSTRIATAVAV